MADALISPAVGGTMIAVSGGLMAYSAKKLKDEMDDKKIPLMGVVGAFVFAAQMINFTIPGTGSSGHIGGGILLSALLGPYAAFLTLASILLVQALFFADGGILAYGCNVFNMGFFPCFIMYPLIFKKIAGASFTKTRVFIAAVVAATIGLQFGAFSVVFETLASGISALPFKTFVILMQPIHLAIGIVEGLATGAILLFMYRTQPEVLDIVPAETSATVASYKKAIVTMCILAVITGGLFSWFASQNPDGLEWSMAKIIGGEELSSPENKVHGFFDSIQKKTAFLPDYNFKKEEPAAGAEPEQQAWPAVDKGTSTAGFVGGVFTLALALCVGLILKRRKVVES